MAEKRKELSFVEWKKYAQGKGRRQDIERKSQLKKNQSSEKRYDFDTTIMFGGPNKNLPISITPPPPPNNSFINITDSIKPSFLHCTPSSVSAHFQFQRRWVNVDKLIINPAAVYSARFPTFPHVSLFPPPGRLINHKILTSTLFPSDPIPSEVPN